MTVAVGDVLRVDVIGDLQGTDDIVNVYHFRTDGAGPQADADVLEDLKDILDALVDIVKVVIAAAAIFRRIRVQNITQGLLVGEIAFDAPIIGTGTGQLMNSQATIPVSFKTSTPRVILRKHVGPLTEGALDTLGRLDATLQDDMANYAAALMVDLPGTFMDYRFGYPSPVAATFVTPTVGIVSVIPGALRSRRFGVGS